MRIVTLTLNPTLDVSTSVQLVEPWHKLRCDKSTIEPGGGGINVARVVKVLGGEPVAVAALGGHVGSMVRDAVGRLGVDVRPVPIRGATRQDFAVAERSTSRQYRFVQPGPRLTAAEWQRCLDATIETAGDAAWVVASGSLPPGVPPRALTELAERLHSNGIPLIVDTSGPGLAAACRAPVRLIKPSLKELTAITLGTARLRRRRDITAAARSLLTAGGCETVIVSLGPEGALAVPRDADEFTVQAPAVDVRSASGAGDSMVGGIAFALSTGSGLQDAVRLGVACGTAAVLKPGTGLCDRADVERLLAYTLIDD